MAEDIKTLKASGGDYTNPETWWATECETYDCVTNTTSPVLECYNDWVGGLSDNEYLFNKDTGYSANTAYHPIIRPAAGEGHNGTPNTGFGLKATSWTTKIIDTDASYFEITGVELIGGNSNSPRFNGNYQTYTHLILHGSIANGFEVWNTHTCSHNVVCNAVNFGYVGKWLQSSVEITNCVAANCADGFKHSSNTPTVINCVAVDCTTDFSASMIGDYNASSDTSAPGANSIHNITSAVFIDAANDDFRITEDSALFEAGDAYRVSIGAHQILKYALRTDAAWAAMSSAEQAVYEDQYDSMQTWWDTEAESNNFGLTAKILECYNDWPAGLSEIVDFTSPNMIADISCRPEIRAAAGHECGGFLNNGFGIKAYKNYGSLIDTHLANNITLKNFWFQNTGSTSAQGLYGQSNLRARGLVGKAAAGAAFYNIATGDEVTECLAIDSGRGFSNYNWNNGVVKNCVAANCATGFYSESNGSYLVKNSVAYGCTTSYSGSNFSASCTNNAASDASSNTPPGSNPVTTDIVSADFADAANDDYHLASGSQLIGAGANLYTDGSDVDIDGEAWPNSAWDIGFDYFVSSETPIEIDAIKAALAITAKTAGISLGIEVLSSLASKLISSKQANVAISSAIEAQKASKTISSKTSGISLGTTIEALKASKAISSKTSEVSLGTTVEALKASKAIYSKTSGISLGTTIEALKASKAISSKTSGISLGTTIEAQKASKAISSKQASITIGAIIEAQKASKVISSNTSEISLGTAIEAQKVSKIISSKTSGISLGTTIEAKKVSKVISSKLSEVAIGEVIFANLASKSIAVHAADISASVIIEANKASKVISNKLSEVAISIETNANKAAKVITTNIATVELGIAITPAAVNKVLTSKTSSISTGIEIISSAVESRVISSKLSDIALGTAIDATKASKAISSRVATITKGFELIAIKVAKNLIGNEATIALTRTFDGVFDPTVIAVNTDTTQPIVSIAYTNELNVQIENSEETVINIVI